MSVSPSMQMTKAQRAAIFTVLSAAARSVGEDSETYRKRILREELGVDHFADVTRTNGFDRLMCRMYSDRGEYDYAIQYSQNSLARIRHLITDAAMKIVQRTQYKGSGLDYVAGVMRQSGLIDENTPRSWCERLANESGWLDFTDEQLKRLLVILNTYLARFRK